MSNGPPDIEDDVANTQLRRRNARPLMGGSREVEKQPRWNQSNAPAALAEGEASQRQPAEPPDWSRGVVKRWDASMDKHAGGGAGAMLGQLPLEGTAGHSWQGRKMQMRDFAAGKKDTSTKCPPDTNHDDEDVKMTEDGLLENDPDELGIISIKDLEASSRGERELWIQALKAKRETGKLLEVPEDEVEEEVVEKKDKPPVPFKTAWGCTPTSALRKFFMKLAVNRFIELFWMLNTIAHFVFLIPFVKNLKIFGSEKESLWFSAIFVGVYVLELAIKTVAWGLYGGRYAYLNYDIFNRIDFFVTVTCCIEIIVLSFDATFSFRAFRMFRLLRPLLQLELFAGIETIIITLETSVFALLTVIYLVFFMFVLYGIAGMDAYAKSFRRRCVWADALELKQPEQFCKDDDAIPMGTALGLNSGCGPLQLCLDIGAPNSGFTSYQNMPTTLLTIFQAFSQDGQYTIMWITLESEPFWAGLSAAYWISLAFVCGQILVNVFIAVLASIFSRVRAEFFLQLQREREEKAALQGNSDSRQGSLRSGADQKSDVEGSYSSASRLPSREMRQASPQSGYGSSTDSTLECPRKLNSHLESRLQSGTGTLFAQDDNLQSRQGRRSSMTLASRELSRRSADPALPQLPEDTELYRYLPDAVDEKGGMPVEFSYYVSIIFRSWLWKLITLFVIITNSIALCVHGYFEDPWYDNLIEDVERLCSIFFAFELVIQIMCDGSLYEYFKSGEHVFDFLVATPTTAALVAELVEANKDQTALLRGMAILRALRGSKYFFFRPIWLILIKAARSIVAVMNLNVVIILFLLAWALLGAAIFSDEFERPASGQYHYRDLGSAMITLFQVFTGDSWTSVMFDRMERYCTPLPGDCTTGKQCLDCDYGHASVAAMYYIVIFWMGQYVFVPLFLGVILENFAVTEFINLEDRSEMRLDKDQALVTVAEFQMLPPEAVNKSLIGQAFHRMVDSQSLLITKSRLLRFVRYQEPKILWRISKSVGLIAFRSRFRRLFRITNCCIPWPGDSDWRPKRAVVIHDHVLERQMAIYQADRIRELLSSAELMGLGAKCADFAEEQGVGGEVDPENLGATDAQVAVRLLQHPALCDALKCHGEFDPRVQKQNPTYIDMFRVSSSASRKAMNEERDDDPWGFDDWSETSEHMFVDDQDLSQHPIRRLLRWLHEWLVTLTTSGPFATLIYLSIAVSSILLALDTPSADIPGLVPPRLTSTLNAALAGIFALEMVAKITAFGLYTPRHLSHDAYVQSIPNLLDALVVMVSIADVFDLSKIFGNNATRVILLGKMLRPLRLLGRNAGMRAIVGALVWSAKPIVYAFGFLVLIVVVFAVLGMAIFKNSMHFCNDFSLRGDLGEGVLECVDTFLKEDETASLGRSGGVLLPRVWDRPRHHFDDFPHAALSLCRVLTLKWVSVWQSTTDIVGKGVQPVPGYNIPTASAFFIIFVFIGSFFSVNLFVSFVVDGFYAAQGLDSQFAEIQYASIQTMVNVVCMATSHDGQDPQFEYFLAMQNNVFFGIMCSEFVLSLIGFGVRICVTQGQYQFDLFLILCSIATASSLAAFRSSAQVVRVMRLFRFLRVLARSRLVSNVLETVVISMKQVVSIVLVLFIFASMFAVVGVASFGTTKFGHRLGTRSNFTSYHRAMLTLFQIIFGDEWHELLDDCQLLEPECTRRFIDPGTGEELSYGDCGSWYAPIYYMFYILLCTFTMINLFVGMIMNNFAYITSKETKRVINAPDLEKLQRVWIERLDPNATGFIQLEQVYQLMILAGAPLGMFGRRGNHGRYLCIRNELDRMLEDMEIQKETEDEISASDSSVWWAYNTKLRANIGTLAWIVHRIDRREERIEEWWQRRKASVDDKLIKLRTKLAAVRQLRTELESGGGLTADERYEAARDEAQGASKDAAEPRSGAQSPSTTLKGTRPVSLFALHQSGASSQGTAETVGISGTFFGATDRCADESLECKEGRFGASGPPVTRVPGRLCRHGRVVPHVPDGVEARAGLDASVLVSGAGMGQGKRSSVSKGSSVSTPVARVEPRGSMMKGTEKPKAVLEALCQEKLGQFRKQEEDILSQIRKQEARMKPSGLDRLADLPFKLVRRFVRPFLPRKLRKRRPPGSIFWDEIIDAMLYWNKKGGIVPMRVAATRRVLDSEIVLEVADQMIEALFLGWLLRRRTRVRAKAKEIQKRSIGAAEQLQRLNKMGSLRQMGEERHSFSLPETLTEHEHLVLLKAQKIDSRNEGLKTARQILARMLVRGMLRPIQLEEVKARMIKEEREEEHDKRTYEEKIRYTEAAKHDTAEVRTVADWRLWHSDDQLVLALAEDLGPDGVLALQPEEQRALISHKRLAHRVEQLFAREQMLALLGQGLEPLLRMTCDMNDIHHMDIDLVDLEEDDMIKVLADPTVKAKSHWRAAAILTGLRESDGLKAAGEKITVEAVDVKAAIAKAHEEVRVRREANDALVERIAETQQKLKAVRAEQDRLKAEFVSVPVKSSTTSAKFEPAATMSTLLGASGGPSTPKAMLPGAVESPSPGRSAGTPKAHSLTSDEAMALREAAKAEAAKADKEAGLSPAEAAASREGKGAKELSADELERSLTAKRSEIERLQRMLARAEKEEAHAQQEGAGRLSEEELAARQARIAAAKKRRQEADAHLIADSSSAAAAMGIGGEVKPRKRAEQKAEPGGKPTPTWL